MKVRLLLGILFSFTYLNSSATGWGDKGTGSGDVPGSSYYETFDTASVHYWMMTGLQLKDSVTLTLAYNKSCDYYQPIAGHDVTSKFGKRRRRMHYGTDLDLESGDRVGSAFEGMVRFAKWNDSYGNLVVVRHPNGLETYYAHLSRIDVKAGDYVQAGDLVGLGGNTGRSFGAHLHFEIRFLGMPIDAQRLIDFSTGKLLYSSITIFRKKDKLDFANAERYHIVAPGEDIYSISRAHEVTVDQLLDLNGLREDDVLMLDSRLRYF